MTICIIGIDCATEARKVGLARGFVTEQGLVIDKVTKPTGKQTVCELVTQWVDCETKTLLAIDAPLGWPQSLGAELAGHFAGNHIAVEPNALFRRYTDQFVKQHTGKQSLDVGADRIARTAHAALKILADVGKVIGEEIALAWEPQLNSEISAIEVYPAATLKASGLRGDGYKKKENTEQRRELCDKLVNSIEFSTDISLMINDDDVLDAAVCVLSGYYFLTNQCMPPDDYVVAKKEGWIWVKK